MTFYPRACVCQHPGVCIYIYIYIYNVTNLTEKAKKTLQPTWNYESCVAKEYRKNHHHYRSSFGVWSSLGWWLVVHKQYLQAPLEIFPTTKKIPSFLIDLNVYQIQLYTYVFQHFIIIYCFTSYYYYYYMMHEYDQYWWLGLYT
jgi:hypothetical protein